MKEGWTTRKFSDIFDLQMGKTPSRDNSSYWGGTNTWVSIADMNCGKYIYDTKEHITNSAVSESGIYRVSKDTVIMSFKLSIGKTAIATKDLYTNEAIMSFNTKEGFEILPDYIYYYLKGYKWQGMNKAVMGMTLNKKAISNNIFSYPNTLQQQHIVEELDLLSSIIEKKKAQLNELDNLAQSLFYEMFGDPITNEKGWEIKTWKDVFETKTGKLNANAMVEGGIYPFFTCSKEISYIDTYAFDCEALLLAGNNASANYDVKYYKGKFNAYQRTYVLTIKEGAYPFYKISLEGKLSILQSHSLGGLTKYLTMGVLSGLSFIAPPISLQQQFASKIEAIEHQKELIKQSIKEVETLFNSRMDYYFN